MFDTSLTMVSARIAALCSYGEGSFIFGGFALPADSFILAAALYKAALCTPRDNDFIRVYLAGAD